MGISKHKWEKLTYYHKWRLFHFVTTNYYYPCTNCLTVRILKSMALTTRSSNLLMAVTRDQSPLSFLVDDSSVHILILIMNWYEGWYKTHPIENHILHSNIFFFSFFNIYFIINFMLMSYVEFSYLTTLNKIYHKKYTNHYDLNKIILFMKLFYANKITTIIF